VASFHDFINARIAALGLTRTELLDRLDRQGAGVHPNTVYQWTHGVAVPSRHHLTVLLDVLLVTEREERAEACLLALTTPAAVAAPAVDDAA
jgi:hypothetical protein